MPRRLCLRCGARTQMGSLCPACAQLAGSESASSGTSRPAPTGSGWRWQRLSERVLKRDGWRCQLCDGPAQQVDHIIPRADGGTDDLGNLRAVCRTCHQRLTRNWRRRRAGWKV